MSGLLLAVETATPRTTVALLDGATLVHEGEGERGKPTAEVLLPAIDALFAATGRQLAEVEAFAVSIGPGSFTSLRIGLATIKGLAFGSDRLAVGVPTLAALALGAPAGEGPAIGMLDARRDEVYAACYADDGFEAGVVPGSVYGADELAGLLPSVCRLVGEGASIVGERLAGALGPGVGLFPEVEPRAAYIGQLAAAALIRGEGEDPAELAPRYLRRAQAEVVRTGLALE